jgi:hypothetical protein
MCNVRIAENKDIDDILRLYKAGLKELGEDYKDSLVLNKVVTCFHLAPCFLVEINDNIVGMAGLTTVTTSHTGDASLADYMFYIEPEHRNIRTLDALMKEIKGFAVSKNLPIRLDFLVDGEVSAKARLFERYGFKPFSVVGVYNG